MGYFGSHLHVVGPACESSAGRWCSSARCCAEMPNCHLSAGLAEPAEEQEGRKEKGQDIKRKIESVGLKFGLDQKSKESKTVEVKPAAYRS